MTAPRVFLDTNIISSATDEKMVQRPEVHQGKHCSKGQPDRDVTIIMQSLSRRPPKEVGSPEIPLLRDVAKLGETASVKFCWSQEVKLELLFQPRVSSYFHRAEVAFVLVPSATDYRDLRWPRFAEEGPGAYVSPSPVLKRFTIALQEQPDQAAALVDQFLLRLPDNSPLLHHDFRSFHSAARATHKVSCNAATVLLPSFQRLQDGRYLELLDMLAVRQLADDKKANGYVDAFLLWTAELANCNYFLTMDSDILERHRHGSLMAVLPSRFLAELA